MTLRDDQIDLCINCRNIHHCFYCRNQKESVLFCEEFTCDEPKASFIPLRHLDADGAMPLDKKQGLCNNCRQMNWCSRNKTPVRFYCEEHE